MDDFIPRTANASAALAAGDCWQFTSDIFDRHCLTHHIIAESKLPFFMQKSNEIWFFPTWFWLSFQVRRRKHSQVNTFHNQFFFLSSHAPEKRSPKPSDGIMVTFGELCCGQKSRRFYARYCDHTALHTVLFAFVCILHTEIMHTMRADEMPNFPVAHIWFISLFTIHVFTVSVEHAAVGEWRRTFRRCVLGMLGWALVRIEMISILHIAETKIRWIFRLTKTIYYQIRREKLKWSTQWLSPVRVSATN